MLLNVPIPYLNEKLQFEKIRETIEEIFFEKTPLFERNEDLLKSLPYEIRIMIPQEMCISKLLYMACQIIHHHLQNIFQVQATKVLVDSSFI